MTTRAPFIVLEGPDGSGTTVHSRLLAERLRAQGHDVLITAEPTAGPVGVLLRNALKTGALGPAALQLLFCADRADHVAHVIDPARARGEIVVSDRYLHSTLAYGEALGLDGAWLREVNRPFPRPDCVLFLLPPVGIARDRIRERAEQDSLEDEDLQERVHASYHRMAKEDTAITVIDTSADREAVSEHIWNTVNKFLSSFPASRV